MERTDNTLKILVTVSSILFLLVAIKTSYPAESTSEMTINIAGKFITYELFLLSFIYVGGPLLSDAMPRIWEWAQKFHQKMKSTQTPASKATENNDSEDDERVEDIESIEDEISDEIIEYTNKTFENILTPEQIEKILYGLRNFNRGGRFGVIVKEEFRLHLSV